MLTLIPILLLVVFATAIYLLGRYKLSAGSTWLAAAGSVLFIWVLYIVLRIAMPEGINIADWSPQGISSDLLIFKISTNTWVFAFLLISLLVGVVFTDTIRLEQGNHLTTWTGSMILTAVGLLSIYSQTFLAAVITWTIIDIVEFGLLIRLINQPKVQSAAILEFGARLIGTIMIVGVLVSTNAHSLISDNSQYTGMAYGFLLMGATLRLGVLPIHISLTENLPIQRSMGTVLRFVSPLSIFAFLTQIPPQAQLITANNFFFVIAVFSALYAAVKWITSKDELTGRPYWLLFFSCLVLLSFLKGQTAGCITSSMIMVIGGGFIFLRSYSMKAVRVLGVLCFLLLVGFPYTPTATLWDILLSPNRMISDILLSISYTLIWLGFFRFFLSRRENESGKELWMKLFYSIGLSVLVLLPCILLIWNASVIEQVSSKWIASIICSGFVLLTGFVIRKRIGLQFFKRLQQNRFIAPLKKIWGSFNLFFKFEWVTPFLKWVYNLVAEVVKFFINLLEGDGGLLWELLFLVLISSVLIGEIIP